MRYVKYILITMLGLLTFNIVKKKKVYLSFFYGNKQELTKAFTQITGGDFIRYIMTSETLICRFKSNKSMDEIGEIIHHHCPDLPFFIFPINDKYNLPLDVENNLLTENPIIQSQQTQIVNQYLTNLIDLVKERIDITDITPEVIDENDIDQLNIRLTQAKSVENFELAAQIRDKINELKNKLNDERTTNT